jgi:type VI secretion system protein ImpA
MGAQAIPSIRSLEPLLVPISGAKPSGESLRYEGSYDRIAAARREDDSTLSQGVWKSSLKKADWSEVEQLCIDALKNRTKDLQIAAWLVEAWLRLDHFMGIRDGMDLLRLLMERYWDDLYPQIEGEDLDYRIAPVNWINEKLSIQVKLLPITNPDSDDIPGYCWSDWENACRIEVSDPKLKGPAAAAHPPKLTLAEFQKSVMFTPTAYFANLASQVEWAMEACSALEAQLDRRCGERASSLRQFYSVMESIHAFVISTLNQRQPEVEPIPDLPDGEMVLPEQIEINNPTFGAGAITSRDEAYRRLAEAAEYLARVEPHSPAPYLVRRAIHWGSMSLPELLPELVRNQSELAELFRLLQLGDAKTPEK